METILKKVICFFVNLVKKIKEETDYVSEEFTLFVTYGSPLLRCSKEVVFEKFPPAKTGLKEVKVKLFNFESSIDHPEVKSRMSLYGFHPGNVEELSSFGSSYPQLQRAYEPIALGSVYEDKSDNVSYTTRFSREEEKIVTCCSNETWSPYSFFLGVKDEE